MRVRTLEIRWHDSKPINSCDFQSVAFKKARPAHDRDFTAQSYRLATGGEDSNVRVSEDTSYTVWTSWAEVGDGRYGWCIPT